MKYDPDKHHRRSIRLKGYDYSQAGYYFVTICCYQRQCLFGDIVDGVMRLNQYGEIVAETYQWLSQRYPYLILDEWVIMPNHFHGIMVISDKPLPMLMECDRFFLYYLYFRIIRFYSFYLKKKQ